MDFRDEHLTTTHDGRDHAASPAEQRRLAEEAAYERQLEAVMAISLAEQAQRERIERQASMDEDARRADEDVALEAFKKQVEEKRRLREEAQALHEQKVLDAVLKASLVEFNERTRIEHTADDEERLRSTSLETQQQQIAAMKAAAQRSKTTAVQNVLDLKKKAHDAKEQARRAVEEYQNKVQEGQNKLLALAQLEKERDHQALLEAAKQRQEEAAAKRLEAERRAQEAIERAQLMREKALQAAKLARQTSRAAIESSIEQEEATRALTYELKLNALGAEKDEAARVRLEKEAAAQEKLQRAMALSEQAAAASAKLSRGTSKRSEPRPVETDSEDDGDVARSGCKAKQSYRVDATAKTHPTAVFKDDGSTVCVEHRKHHLNGASVTKPHDGPYLEPTNAAATHYRCEKQATLAAKISDAQAAIARADDVARHRIEATGTAAEMALKDEEEKELAAFRAQLEATRAKRREAAEAHDQKVLEAVLAASLFEYTETQRIEKQLADAEAEIERTRQLHIAEQERARERSASLKQAALEAVAASQAKARQLTEAATQAVHAYQETEMHRQEALAAHSEQAAERDLQAQLQALRDRQEAATFRRQESERAAAAAMARAQALRDEAIAKAKHVRELSKHKVTVELDQEAQLRELQYEAQRQALQRDKELATQRRVEREQAAAQAQARAEQLRRDAIAKAKELRQLSKSHVQVQLQREDSVREHSYTSQLGALQADKEAATARRIEAERRAADALARAQALQAQVPATSTFGQLQAPRMARDE
ncbi:hypothetical protein ACHHYP_03428 [Achlya hypogyna]|uniref:Uncharacterized protein n=1 Tax=Achlya hypogyna TaxID=1202772 RepID=A0A1V9ZR68_ACHHY|nr:hypothetical protein ACHHYP_03428 [Achlya hypogyna]